MTANAKLTQPAQFLESADADISGRQPPDPTGPERPGAARPAE